MLTPDTGPSHVSSERDAIGIGTKTMAVEDTESQQDDQSLIQDIGNRKKLQFIMDKASIDLHSFKRKCSHPLMVGVSVNLTENDIG